MSKFNFFNELKRRNVYRVALTYAVAAWLILQIVTVIAPILEAPAWVSKFALIILLAGFPVATILAWVYEMSPQGIIKTPAKDSENEPNPDDENKPPLVIFILGFLILVIVGQFVYGRFAVDDQSVSPIIEKSIAVLPFTNESSNEENVYFCNGVMQSIINHLSKFEEIRVIPRTSVEQFRNDNSSTALIGKELNAGYILQGSVQRIEQRAIIFANLVDTKNERNVWSMTYDRGLEDIFKVQAELTEEIAKELQAFISPELKKRIEAIPTTSTIAYDYYLRANEYVSQEFNATQTNEEWHGLLDKAKIFYKQALEIDSSFAEAYVGLAKVDLLRNVALTILDENYLESVLKLTNKAIEINPDLSDAYLLRSQYYIFNSMEEKAQVDLEKTIQLNPNNIEALYRLSEVAYRALNFENAARIFNRIEERIGTVTEQYQLYDRLWWFYFKIGDMERSEKYGLMKFAINPNAHAGLWLVYGTNGDRVKFLEWLEKDFPEENQFQLALIVGDLLQEKKFKESIPIFQKWERLIEEESEDNWLSHETWKKYGMALIETGQVKKGQDMLNKAIDRYTTSLELGRFNDVNIMYSLAGVYAYLKEYELAFYWLDKFEKDNGWRKEGNLTIWMKRDIFLDNFREDERFKIIKSKALQQQAEIQQNVRDLLP